jgi:hypothetical protein
VGLPVNQRRRSPGLRHEEVAFLASVSPDKISTASPPTTPDKRTVALVRHLVDEYEKLPVFAVDGRGDLISWNAPTREWYADFGGRTGKRPQLPVVVAHRRGGACADRRLGRVRPGPGGGMRYAVGTGTIDPSVQPMLDELHEHCPEFRQWWETHDVVDQEVRRGPSTIPGRGSGGSTCSPCGRW